MPKSNAGDVFNGYTILAPFKIAGGANCEWTFADRSGAEFFIKRFFKPRYPVWRDGKEPAGDWRGRQAECDQFEAQQRRLMKKAAEASGTGGRLVVPTDFFRIETMYYKVAPKVDVSPLSVAEISALPFDEKRPILAAAVSALKALRTSRIVHGDLSPANVLIARAAGGDRYIAKVIDFDSSFLESEPLPPEETMGNPPYYSPELLTYLQTKEEGDRPAITLESDVFAMGIVFCEYLYGQLPQVPDPFFYVCEAVRAGKEVELPARADIPNGVNDLLRQMLHPQPAGRPSLNDLQRAIREGFPARPSEPGPAHPKAPHDKRVDPAPSPVPTVSRVKHNVRSTDPGPPRPVERPAEPAAPYAGPSRIRSRRKTDTEP